MDEKKIRAGKFMFVSYCHSDDVSDNIGENGIICTDILSLQSKGARLWFDENLWVGDNWRERVKNVLNDENCVGVIIYNSAQSFLKEAMYWERQQVQEAKKRKKNFWISCVQLNQKSIKDLVNEATQIAVERDLLYECLDYINDAKKSFSDDVLMIRDENPETRINSILEEIVIRHGIIDSEASMIENMQRSGVMSKDSGKITFGICTGIKSSREIAVKGKSRRYPIGDKICFVLNDELYETIPLCWTLFSVEEKGETGFIADRIVATGVGFDAERFLRDEFLYLAFSEDEQKLINRIDLMELSEFEKLSNSGIEFTKVDRFWWLKGECELPGWMPVAKNGKLNRNGLVSTLNKGIRPVIYIQTSNVVKLKKES